MQLLSAAIETETRVRENAIHQIDEATDGLNKERLDEIETKAAALKQTVDAIEIPTYDFSVYSLKSRLASNSTIN